MIVGITGMPGAGKSEVASILQRQGFKVVEMGDAVKEMMQARGIELTNESFRTFATQIRKKYGKTVVAKETTRIVAKMKNRNICIAGIRSTYEIDYFRKRLGNIKIIAVIAPKKVRFRRLKSRQRKDDPLTKSGFRFREQKEKSWGLYDAIKRADFVITNMGTSNQLRADVKDVVRLANK